MGFYGNITNTSNTTFSFDRIYPNRLAMDANVNNDGIFIGRYVLVEYQEKAAYPVAYHATETSEDSGQYYFYSSTNQEEISKIKYLGLPPGEPDRLPSVDDVNAIYQDGFYKGEILQRYIYSSDKKDWIFSEEFYACVGEDDKHFAIFEPIADPSMKSHYIQNFEIDEKHYGQESKGFKGYDSTVWMKSSVTASDGKLITKYVNIADLNSVVPTFDIAADAPTMTPITPHFDADSTNVYYKLHTQTPYGFRVKAEANEKLSDEKTKHYEVSYSKDTNITTSTPQELDAAIYYNKDAFRAKPYIDQNTGETISVVKRDETTTNEIKILPSGYSNNYANKYSHKPTSENPDLVGDIQEFSLHLPAIGNMMSDAWDIIHGPNRDDARTDDNSSLQGRLDSFRFMADNQIPVKRANDGTLIGTNINGNNQCEVPEQGILGQSLTTSFDTDDAWIRTEINTNGLLDELGNEIGNNGISIHHTFHSKKDTETSANKNNNNGDGINQGIGNNLKLYTPIVDAAGHVVGKNIETVTLPYGYKYFKTDGIVSEDEKGDLYSTNVNTNGIQETKPTKVESDTEAHNTQDTLSINPANKWIQTKLVDTENDGDVLTIAHEIHSINETVSEQGDNETSHSNLNKENGANNEVNLTMYDWTYDKAGHITSKREHTYTLPYGYKYIEVANDGNTPAVPVSTTGTQVADNTQDTLKLTTSNKWILLDAKEEDTVKFGHLLKTIAEDKKPTQNLSSEESKTITFEVYDDSFDEAGHHNGRDTKTITMPFGYGKIKGDSGNTEATATFDELNVVSGDDWIDTSASTDQITITHTGPVFTSARNESNKTPNFGDTFTIEDWVFDDKGHKSNLSTHSIKIPKGSLNDLAATSSSVLTGISMIDETGVITQTNNDVGKLALTGYVQGSDKTDIGSGDTINSAFAKLQNQITYEENRINTILTGENDLTDTLDTFIELQSYINEHGQEAADMAKAIENEIARAKEAEEANITAIENEKIRAENIEQGLQGQIEVLQITIENLQKQINELKNPPQQPDNGGDEV